MAYGRVTLATLNSHRLAVDACDRGEGHPSKQNSRKPYLSAGGAPTQPIGGLIELLNTGTTVVANLFCFNHLDELNTLIETIRASR